MGIDRAGVKHVARLARLALTAAEEEHLAAELGSVLGYIDRLAQVDVEGVEPLSFAGGASALSSAARPGASASAAGVGSPASAQDAESLSLRTDAPVPSLPREAALGQAPAQDGGAFLVPRILE